MEDYRGGVCFFTPLGLLRQLTDIEGLYLQEYILGLRIHKGSSRRARAKVCEQEINKEVGPHH